MKNIKVVFSTGSGFSSNFTGIFETEEELDNFVEQYQNYGGVQNFVYKIYKEDCEEKLPILKNDAKSAIMVFYAIYPVMRKK